MTLQDYETNKAGIVNSLRTRPVTDTRLAAQQIGMLEDINTALTLEELRALAGLESEYPLVFSPDVRFAMVRRKQLLRNDLPAPAARRWAKGQKLCASGQPHATGFYASVCRLCQRAYYLLRRKKA